MNIYKLALFASLNPAPPCFVIPVFTTSTSNETFAQDLRVNGRIGTFMLFDPHDFLVVPSMAPAIERRPGESGLLGYWAEEGVVLCGTSSQLKSVLAEIKDMDGESPFVDVERATFLEDDQKLREATAAAAALFANESAQSSYYARVKRRVRLFQTLREEDLHQDDDDDEEVSGILSVLEHEKDNQAWIKYWKDAWSRFYGNSRLVNIACWRIMTAGLGDEEFSVISDIRYYGSENLQSLYSWWLANRAVEQFGWIIVWHLSDKAPEIYSPQNAIEGLKLAFEQRSLRRQQWLLLAAWAKCFREFDGDREAVASIARQNDGIGFHKEYFIDSVVMPVHLKVPNDKWSRDKLYSWFNEDSGSSLWIRLFISYAPDILSPSGFIKSSVRWLRRYGTGTNRWYDLYQMVENDISEEESWSLRVMWLKSARKDLYSWPTVFESLADSARKENYTELAEIARSWKFRGRKSRQNATVEEFAER